MPACAALPSLPWFASWLSCHPLAQRAAALIDTALPGLSAPWEADAAAVWRDAHRALRAASGTLCARGRGRALQAIGRGLAERFALRRVPGTGAKASLLYLLCFDSHTSDTRCARVCALRAQAGRALEAELRRDYLPQTTCSALVTCLWPPYTICRSCAFVDPCVRRFADATLNCCNHAATSWFGLQFAVCHCMSVADLRCSIVCFAVEQAERSGIPAGKRLPLR